MIRAMPQPDIGRGFRDVDASGTAELFIAYLDEARELLAEFKERAIGDLNLGAGDSVLEVGCGTGDDLPALAAAVAPGRVVGVDVSESLVDEARRRTREFGEIEIMVGDAHALPFAAGEFSASRAERLLEHVAQPEVVLAELARVTCRGGRVVISEPDWDTLIIDSDDLAVARRVARAQASVIRHPDIGRRLARLASCVGLTVLEARCNGIPVRDLAMADAVFRLQSAVDRLADRDVERWWEGLRAEQGSFFAAMMGVTVVALAP
jgi:SAM-dependent methyltransferase